MAFKEVEVIIPNFCGVSYEVDVVLDEARATARRILTTVGASRALFATPPAVAVLEDSMISICCNKIFFKSLSVMFFEGG